MGTGDEGFLFRLRDVRSVLLLVRTMVKVFIGERRGDVSGEGVWEREKGGCMD